MKKVKWLMLMIALPTQLFSQKIEVATGLNLTNFADPSTGLSPAFHIDFSKKFSLLAEPTFFVNKRFMSPEFKDGTSYRMVLQPRFKFDWRHRVSLFDKRKTTSHLFVGIDLRYRYKRSVTNQYIMNHSINDTLFFPLNVSQKFYGMAVVIGQQFFIGEKFILEYNIGAGSKTKKPGILNMPAGYQPVPVEKAREWISHPAYYERDDLIILPFSIRLFYKLN